MTDIPSMAPLIGVTTSEVRRGDLATLRRHGEPPQHEMALGLTYMRAIELAVTKYCTVRDTLDPEMPVTWSAVIGEVPE